MPVSLLELWPPPESLTPDAELLGRFVSARDGAALAELVRRHGPVVHRVCRRLAPAHVDDAFQAVFLVLACHARRIRKPAAVGSWLVGVAGRVARQMRKAERTRSVHESRAGRPEASPVAEPADLAAVLDEELAGLPDELRDPVVLCLVEGRTHAQAADALGGSPRTLRRRLERARTLLRTRLERRGVVPAVTAVLLAGLGASARAVPTALDRLTVATVFQFLDGGATPPVAAAAAKGVVDNMVRFKVPALAVAGVAVIVCLGAALSQERPLPVEPAPAFSPSPVGVPSVPPSAPATAPAAANFRSANFEVHAPTAVTARVIANEAEFHRRAYALKWLGKELPAWPKPCVIRYTTGLGGNGGATTFTFEKNKGGNSVMRSAEMEIRGEFMAALSNLLPHEVTHTVLASAAGRPLPRWADEGMALLSESEDEQAGNDARLRELLGAGRGMRLKLLLPAGEYPKDISALYAQGHSVARFLVGRTGVEALKDIPHLGELFKPDGHRRLLAFVLLGSQKNTAESWNEAAKDVYGFESADALEAAWLEWLKKPESVLAQKEGATRPAPAAKPGGDLIPPIKLPAVRP